MDDHTRARVLELFSKIVETEEEPETDWELLARFNGMPAHYADDLKKHADELGLDDWGAGREPLSAAAEQERSDEWSWLMNALELPLCYYMALVSVLLESDWESAQNAIAYVKTAAQREALKRGLATGADELRSIDSIGRGRSRDFARSAICKAS